MSLINRDVFAWRNSRWRLIRSDARSQTSWIIDIQDRNAWPIGIASSELASCERETDAEPLAIHVPKSVHEAKATCDYALLQQLLAAGDTLFDRRKRHHHIVAAAGQSGRCARTFEKLLRRFWQRGMTKSALLPDFRNCGRRASGDTAGRGRRPRREKYVVYQVTADDTARFDAAIEYYFSDERPPLRSAYTWLCDHFYMAEDGNGKRYPLGWGERPTFRQFDHYFKQKYAIGERLQRRHGDKTYSREHRPKLSDTIADCLGVAHRYEIDATIADVPVVLSIDRKTIIGKATVYLIVDRRSRLIAGFYVGLEHACWETAVEAIVSLTESKREICERYGVEYDPSDWPADGLLPLELLGDRGEMISKASSQLPERLGVSVANAPSLLANFKPNVETRFKLLTMDLRDISPGYDPPEGLGKRRTKHYDKEACLTLHELIAEILEAIIKYNRRPLTTDPRTADQIMRNVEPSPIGLWNDGMQQGSFHGRRFEDLRVRMALLPREKATITHQGLLFKDLYYASDDPWLNQAFVRARNGRDKITVSYDRRSVDYIYVHLPDGKVLPAALSERNHGYRGMSFREAQIVKETAKDQQPEYEQKRLQVDLERRERSVPRIGGAERKRDELGHLSVQARKENSVAARAAEKRQENIDRADRQAAQAGFSPGPVAPPASVTGLPVQNRVKPVEPPTLTEAQLARRRMG